MGKMTHTGNMETGGRRGRALDSNVRKEQLWCGVSLGEQAWERSSLYTVAVGAPLPSVISDFSCETNGSFLHRSFYLGLFMSRDDVSRFSENVSTQTCQKGSGGVAHSAISG